MTKGRDILKKVIITDFNLKYQINKSLNENSRRDIRLSKRYGNSYRKRSRENRERFSTVQIGKYEGQYYLVYNGLINTGGFATRHIAMKWFLKNGR